MARVKTWILAGVLLTLLSGTAAAGDIYLANEAPGYWWYVETSPRYELLIPANQFAYVQLEWGGASSLQVVLEDGGPMLQIGTLPTNDPAAAWRALSAPWSAGLANPNVTTNGSEITTSEGIKARFWVLEGTGGGGARNMLRVVTFVRDGRLTYLMFVGKASDYAGTTRDYWLRAVNSFHWL